MTWLGKGRNRTSWLLLLALFWCSSHHVAPKWDYMCMKQEVEHSPTIHQSLGGPVWKFVHVYSAGTLTVWMRVCMYKGVIKCVGVQYECVCVFVYPVRAGEESKRGLHSSASPSSCTPGTRTQATCLRGFQYPVCVCLCASAAVFTQEMQFIIFVCVSGYYIYSLHTCVHRQMEPGG